MGKNTSGLKPPWKPGESGNPSGRPKKRPVTDEYFAMADQPAPPSVRKKLAKDLGIKLKELPKNLTWSEANSMRRWLDSTMKEGHRAAKEIREAIEGKAPMRLEITGPERKEITILIKHDRTKPRQ